MHENFFPMVIFFEGKKTSKVDSCFFLCPANEEPASRIFWDRYEFFWPSFKSLSIVEHVELNTECESIGSG